MFTIEEIRAMSPEEQATLNRKLGRKLIINRVLIPFAASMALHFAFKAYDSRSTSNH